MIIKISAIVCILFAIGCSTPTRTWSDQNRETVWTAMVAAAEAPEYESDDPRKRWIVTENNVDANPDRGRIRIHRILARSLKLPKQLTQSDRRDWMFEIYLLPSNPPTVTFEALDAGLVRVRTLDEAERYFSLVEKILSYSEYNVSDPLR